jgi:hypothetical protein
MLRPTVGQFVLVSKHPYGTQDKTFATVSCGFLDVGALSDEKTGLLFTNAAGSSQAQFLWRSLFFSFNCYARVCWDAHMRATQPLPSNERYLQSYYLATAAYFADIAQQCVCMPQYVEACGSYCGM